MRIIDTFAQLYLSLFIKILDSRGSTWAAMSVVGHPVADRSPVNFWVGDIAIFSALISTIFSLKYYYLKKQKIAHQLVKCFQNSFQG